MAASTMDASHEILTIPLLVIQRVASAILWCGVWSEVPSALGGRAPSTARPLMHAWEEDLFAVALCGHG